MANSLLDEIRRDRYRQAQEAQSDDDAAKDAKDDTTDAVGSADDAVEAQGNGRRVPNVPEADGPADDDTDVTVEMQPGGAETTRAVTQRRKQSDTTPPRRRRSKGDTVYVRDFPSPMAAEARRCFPTARNNTDALAAYVAYKSGNLEGLTDAQRTLVKEYTGEDPAVTVSQRLTAIERDMRQFLALTRELELAVSYLMFDRLGFRNEGPNSPRDVNLLENGVSDMVERLREMSLAYIRQDKVRKGRPIR